MLIRMTVWRQRARCWSLSIRKTASLPSLRSSGRCFVGPRGCASKISLALVAVVLGLFATAADAQVGGFGQNKIQYRRFDWHVLAGEHVDVFFYPEEERIARTALVYAEESYDTLARRFGHEVRERIPLIVYASHVDFEQTNVLPFVPPEGIRGRARRPSHCGGRKGSPSSFPPSRIRATRWSYAISSLAPAFRHWPSWAPSSLRSCMRWAATPTG